MSLKCGIEGLPLYPGNEPGEFTIYVYIFSLSSIYGKKVLPPSSSPSIQLRSIILQQYD